MKRLILAAVAAATLAPAAFAQTAAQEQLLSTVDRAHIQRMLPGADLTNLTNAQLGALSAALYSSENDFESLQKIRSILNWSK